MPILVDGKVYEPSPFSLESVFEEAVERLSDHIFGAQTIYIGVKRAIKSGTIVGIPDAYLIDMTTADEPRLWIIENEIVRHDPVKHIGPQLLKFVIGFEDDRINIRSFLMEEIAADESKMKRLECAALESSSRNVDNYLDKAVFGDFRGLVLVDEARPELHKVLEKINANISVLEMRAYSSDSGSILYHYDSLYEDDEDFSVAAEGQAVITPDKRAARRLRRASSDTIVVPARADGFQTEFIANSQWYAIRIGAAMKDRLKYIAAYQVAPISAVTHIAEIEEIRPYEDTGKYIVIFKGGAKEISPIPLKDPKQSPQGPVYVRRETLLEASCLDDALAAT